MVLKVYNTLSRKREVFNPIEKDKVKMYACGVTVYDKCHLGHAMQAMVYDVMRAYFKAQGYQVTYVRNFTDVDDKIIRRAAELGISPLEHARNMIERHEHDMALLDIQSADIQPRVSDHIGEIIALIETLIEKSHAYESDGDVYFKLRDYEAYGILSNRTCDDMFCGSRVEAGPKKKDAVDFALWKSAKEGEVAWDSPWGKGRPGWHIECSAMSMKYLGDQFDIHGGGKDLVFPHHENEIAQSEGATGKRYANYWIHNGLVTVDGRKMSKSLANFLSIEDAVEKWYPETIRYTILSHHYAANIDFSEKAFYDAYQRLLYFYNTLAKIDQLKSQYTDYPQKVLEHMAVPAVTAAFNKAMNDNFNTGAAVREMGLAFKFLNDLMAAKKPKLKQKLHTLFTVAEEIRTSAAVLGLLKTPPQQALAGIQKYLIRDRGINTAEIENRIAERTQAREAKDWALADQIRDALIESGVAIMDTPNGTTWQVLP